jgi:hypothetical protein
MQSYLNNNINVSEWCVYYEARRPCPTNNDMIDDKQAEIKRTL